MGDWFKARTARGFTLIELLVVIAMIGVLSSLLLPALGRSKSVALSVNCRSNLRQLGFGVALYGDDCNAYPKTRGNWGNGITYLDWKPFLEAYTQPIKRPRPVQTVFVCPSGEGARFRSGSGVVQIAQAYGYNHDGYQNASGQTSFLGLGGASLALPTRLAEVVAPSNMIALGDGADNGPTNAVAASDIGFYRGENIAWMSDFGPWIRRAQLRHRGRVNMLFCDGHAAEGPVATFFLDRSDQGLGQWNKDNEPHR